MPRKKKAPAPVQKRRAPKAAVKAAMAQVSAATAPKATPVYTPEIPPADLRAFWLSCGVRDRTAGGLLWHDLAAEQRIMRALGLWHTDDRERHWLYATDGGITIEDPTYSDFWHTALVERDAAVIATQARAIADNNANVASLANGLSLDVRVIEASDNNHTARVLQYDALAMAKRIEAANAKHKNRDKTRATNKNRHLKLVCPTCGLPARCSHLDRVLVCGGRFGATHEPAVMQPDEGSQPDYRLADAAAGSAIDPEAELAAELADGAKGQHDRSASQLASRKAHYAKQLAGLGNPQETADMVLAAADPTAEFGF